MWGGGNSRNPGGPIPRGQTTPLSQQNLQDDMFSNARMSSNQGSSFRFGGQGNVSQNTQPAPSSADEFPPLGRNGNGDIGQERTTSVMSSLGFSSQANANASSAGQGSRAGNGLLNALSANSRSAEVRAPIGRAHFAMVLFEVITIPTDVICRFTIP